MAAAIIFALTMSITLFIFVPKINFLRRDLANLRSGNARVNNRGSVVTGIDASSSTDSSVLPRSAGSLRVMKVSKNLKRSTYKQDASALRPSGGSIEALEVVSKITNKQVEDLRQLLKEAGQIDSATDLRSLVEKVGVDVSADGTYPRTSSGGSIAVSNSTEMGQQEKPTSSKSLK